MVVDYTKSAEYNAVLHDGLIREEWKERGELTSIVSRKMNAMTVSGRVILPFRNDKTRSVTDPPEHSCCYVMLVFPFRNTLSCCTSRWRMMFSLLLMSPLVCVHV